MRGGVEMGRGVTFLLAVMLVLALAVMPAISAEAPRRGGTLVVGMDADPPSLNPITTVANQTLYPSNQIYDTLVGYDEKFNPVPRLATSWTFSPDGKMFRFNLARNVKWHDGRPFSSADVKFTIEVLGPRYNPLYPSLFGALESVDTPDQNTVIIRFKEPNAVLLSFLGDPAMNILPKHIYEVGDARTNPANVNPVGTGAFKFREWVRGDHLTLVRNEAYFRPNLPYLDQIVFRVVPSAASQVAALERGEIQVLMPQIAPSDAQRLARSQGVKVVSKNLGADFTGLWPNLRVPPLNSLRVRQALSLAADRQRMVEQITLGQSKSARAPISSTSPYFDPTLPELKRDVAAANKLLDEAGLKRGPDGMRFTVRIHHVSTLPDFVKTAQILRENFEDIGVRVNLVSGEVATTLEAIFANWDFDLAVYSARVGPEPGLQYPRWFTTRGLTRAFFSNATGYSNLTVDRLTQQSVTIVDKDKRTAVYRQIQRVIMVDLPTIPLWEFLVLGAHRTELENVFAQPDHRYIYFAETWLRR